VGPNAAQPGGVPIWIGGHSRRAQRRAAELGDGWQATRVTRAELAAGRDNIQALLPRYGREPGAVLLAVAMSVWAPGTGPAGEVHESDLVGSAAEMAERVRAYRAEGVEHLLLQLQPSDSYAASLEAVEFFGREVRPLLSN
jgi:alkanesulfonate monooxygenase SsuD/methylene tetrahydromethanopterin reductase-like flavin-dependent oxidoreductase (luciferase family)